MSEYEDTPYHRHIKGDKNRRYNKSGINLSRSRYNSKEELIIERSSEKK
jgi:hypothetical protein